VFDAAAAVADEKLFGPSPIRTSDGSGAVHLGSLAARGAPVPQAFGAWSGGELVGVASVAGRYLRVLGVMPTARNKGVGSALLLACENAARANNQGKLSVLDQPGNYLAPGVDERNVETIDWLGRRGFLRGAETRSNLVVSVRGNPRVTPDRLAQLLTAVHERGYEVRRATAEDREPLCAAILGEFGGAWPFEVERALESERSGVHVALKHGAYCSFAAHDGNNRGLGWFGPTGTWPAHRSQGLGEALLLACLVDVAAHHAECEIAWIGPRAFYAKACGILRERTFATFSKPL
jgi:GNAT superfamily N-acetyltransferase